MTRALLVSGSRDTRRCRWGHISVLNLGVSLHCLSLFLYLYGFSCSSGWTEGVRVGWGEGEVVGAAGSRSSPARRDEAAAAIP